MIVGCGGGGVVGDDDDDPYDPIDPPPVANDFNVEVCVVLVLVVSLL